MTLPFRRRHHDAESGHDRARMLMSDGLLATLEPEDAAWLGKHLDGCVECGRDWKAFRADHRLLRSLRDKPPEPPRDLWARTSAAIDREAQRRGAPAASRDAREQGRRGGWRALPLGAAASVVVLAVFIGSRLIDRTGIPTTSADPGSQVAVNPTAAPTGLDLPPAEPVAIFRETANGSWELVYKDVEEVCPKSNPNCVPKPSNDGEAQPIDLGEAPAQIALSGGQLAIASVPTNGDPGKVLVVPVAGPGETPDPTVTDPPTAPPSSGETPAPTPSGAIEIASGVKVIGDVAYSEDGRWLAFSAQPTDESTGPDLYLWSPGQATATAVTSDHQTYFSSWHEGAVLASRVEIPGAPAAPGASGDPDASPKAEETDKPGRGNQGGGGKPRASDAPTAAPTATASVPDASGQPSGSAAPPVEGHPISFLLDPETLERTDLTRSDVWLPVLDPTGQFVVYWSGTLRSSDDGHTWALGAGELVLDRWSIGEATPGASATPESSGPSASAEPAPSAAPIGPAGLPTILVPGVKATFEARFDPDGERLAIWVGEALNEEVGRLHLVVLDPETGAVAEDSPLPGEPALRRFSIDKGLLAWVTPRGQDGRESIVQMLGWRGDEFGEIETEPGSDLYLP